MESAIRVQGLGGFRDLCIDDLEKFGRSVPTRISQY